MGCSVGFRYAKNALAAVLCPRPHEVWGAHYARPYLIVGWVGGHQSQ